MDEISTLNDLIRFAYHETDILETVLISNLIDEDPIIGALYHELMMSVNAIEASLEDPSDDCIKSVCGYAQSIAYN